ncbi:hypothetical protein PMAC_001847 [Pneumocystis sp. 'macacae']|nr:hypothetical protein PMAC_001847 [Pneumocystis sp. 'macacae']
MNEIVSFVMSVPGLRRLLGDAADVFIHEQMRLKEYKQMHYDYAESLQSRKALQALLRTLLTQSAEHVETCSKQLLLDIHEKMQDAENIYKDVYEVVLRLNDQFPGDIGIFCAFLLNHVRLMPGEGIFLEANTPHAYLCGGKKKRKNAVINKRIEAIECMSSSDNVVRAGLTSKFKDIETLVSMLTYKCASASEQKIRSISFDRTIGDGEVHFFKPPINEFSVLQIYLKKDHIQKVEGLKGPSIMICTQGNGIVAVEEKQHFVRAGLVFFVGAFLETVFTANSDLFIIYRAFVEV